jgi:hypothetical protein
LNQILQEWCLWGPWPKFLFLIGWIIKNRFYCNNLRQVQIICYLLQIMWVMSSTKIPHFVLIQHETYRPHHEQFWFCSFTNQVSDAGSWEPLVVKHILNHARSIYILKTWCTGMFSSIIKVLNHLNIQIHLEWVSDYCLSQNEQFFNYTWREQGTVLDQK